MVRVAMVTPYPRRPDSVDGGVEGVARYLSQELTRVRGLRLDIVAPRSVEGDHTENWGSIRIHRLGAGRLPGCADYFTRTRSRIHAKLKELAPDLTHFQCNAGWAIGYRRPRVLTIHGIAERDARFGDRGFKRLRGAVYATVERYSRRRADHVICISPYVREALGAQLRGTTWDIENPVDPRYFEVQGLRRKPIILYAGRICKRKNLLTLLKAFRFIRAEAPGALLKVAGRTEDARYAAECAAFVEERGLRDAVRFLGPISIDELCSEMGEARCLALTSYQETAPLAVAEAMAAGLPVVASDRCGLRHMVADGETGFLVDPSDEFQIADRLRAVLSDAARTDAFSKAVRERARARFEVGAVVGRTLEVYRTALGDGRGRRNWHWGPGRAPTGMECQRA